MLATRNNPCPMMARVSLTLIAVSLAAPACSAEAPEIDKRPFYGLATLCVGVGMGVSTIVEWIGD